MDIDSQLSLLRARLQEEEGKAQESRAAMGSEAAVGSEAAEGTAECHHPAVVASEVRGGRSSLRPEMDGTGRNAASPLDHAP